MGLSRPSRDDEKVVTLGMCRPGPGPRSLRRSMGTFSVLFGLSLGQSLWAQPPWEACESAPGMAQAFVGQWRSLLAGRSSLSPGEFADLSADLIDRTVAVGVMAQEILRGEWDHLRPADRNGFLAALRISLRDGLVSFLEGELGGAVPTLTPMGDGDHISTVQYSLETSNGRAREITLHLAGVGGDGCKIVDIEYDGDELLKEYRDRVEDLVDDYSYPYMIAKLGNRDELILDDFEASPLGQFPIGWGQREDDDEPPYRIREEGGNRYLEATDEGESVIIGLETPWNLDEYPYISFRLRVNRIPEGADERDDRKVDSAAGVYVTIKKVAFGRIPESVKYVWSSTLPVGAATRREGIGRPWQVVVGSGHEGLGEWKTYVFDLRDAYRKTFGGNPGSKPAGIGVLSDANSLRAEAYADYDDFKALKRAPAGVTGGVVERMRPLRRR